MLKPLDDLPPDHLQFLVMYLKFDVPFFKIYDICTLLEIVRVMKPFKFQKGDWLYRQGQPFDHVYVVVTGSIALFHEVINSRYLTEEQIEND